MTTKRFRHPAGVDALWALSGFPADASVLERPFSFEPAYECPADGAGAAWAKLNDLEEIHNDSRGS